METFQGIKPAKVEKAAKETKGMFQSLIGASMGPVGAILKLLESLKPFMAIIKIIQGLFDVLVGAAMKPLIEALKPLFRVLTKLTPIFEILGTIIGTLLTIALIPLTVAFKILEPILDLLMPYIEDFSDILDELSPIIEIVTEVIGFLMKLALIPLAVAIFWVGETIFAIIDALTVGAVKGRGAFRDFFADLFTLLGVPLPGFLKSHVSPPEFQYGGIMPYTGLAKLEKGEKVTTAYENREMIDLLQEISNSNRKILMDKEFRHR